MDPLCRLILTTRAHAHSPPRLLRLVDHLAIFGSNSFCCAARTRSFARSGSTGGAKPCCTSFSTETHAETRAVDANRLQIPTFRASGSHDESAHRVNRIFAVHEGATPNAQAGPTAASCLWWENSKPGPQLDGHPAVDMWSKRPRRRPLAISCLRVELLRASLARCRVKLPWRIQPFFIHMTRSHLLEHAR